MGEVLCLNMLSPLIILETVGFLKYCTVFFWGDNDNDDDESVTLLNIKEECSDVKSTVYVDGENQLL